MKARNHAVRQLDTLLVDDTTSPHHLITLLLDGALGRLTEADQRLTVGRRDLQVESLEAAASIIGGLRDSLDLEQGGELAANLDDLYDYMLRRLSLAAANGDAAPIREVSDLLGVIREGWTAIADKATQSHVDVCA